ncbi:MAG: transporter substrate-binding domain-containing protein [Desulfobacteraceae bacterium]|nr:transporter substrate-binding domain-containing protein [Desulfobacteraceae bacterium]
MKTRYLSIIMMVLLFSVQVFAQDRQVKLLTLEWEPYVGANLPKQGFAAEIVSLAFKKAGYKVTIEFRPWDTALEVVKQGGADGVFPAYHEAGREAYYLFSNPFFKSPLGLCKIKDYAQPSPSGGFLYKRGANIRYDVDPRIDQALALEKLRSYRFGVVRGYANTPEFDRADFLTKIIAETDADNIGNLLQNEVELAVIDRYVAQNILVKKFPWRFNEVEFMEPPLALRNLYIAMSKKTDNPEKKLRDFNAGLEILRADGILDSIMARYGLKKYP